MEPRLYLWVTSFPWLLRIPDFHSTPGSWLVGTTYILVDVLFIYLFVYYNIHQSTLDVSDNDSINACSCAC